MNVIELEQPEGVIASLGGQTAINLAEPLMQPRRARSSARTAPPSRRAENRDAFEKVHAGAAHPAAARARR